MDYRPMLGEESDDLSGEEDETDATMTEDPEEQLAEMRRQLAVATELHRDKVAELERVEQFWEARKETLKKQLTARNREVTLVEREIQKLDQQMQHGSEPPPGPKWLMFIEGTVFPVVVACVIVLNMISMTLSILHPNYGPIFRVIDRLCLLFYIVELALRASYWQHRFLRGALRVVAWHWLDTFLVVDGILFIVLPESSSAAHWVNYLRVLRLLRYLRIVKLIHTVLQTDLSWTSGDLFSSVIMVVICMNAIVMGAEIEYPNPPLCFLWVCLEHIFLLIFTFELAVRLKYQGWTFFTNPAEKYWNWIDFIIVCGGIIDQWFLPTIGFLKATLLGLDNVSATTRSMSDLLRLVRVARLLRILRLMRLIKNIPPLYTLIIGIVKAMQGMSWVMLLTMTVLYISALVGVKLVGPEGMLVSSNKAGISEDATSAHARILHHAGTGSNTGEASDDVTSCFPNMFDAIFNMFKVMQMDLEPMEPMFNWSPVSKYVIMCYVVVTNWAIFSILTAVVSDEMAKVTEKLESEVADVEKKRKNNKLVENIFDRIDVDKSGDISKEDFMKLLENEHETQELCDAAELEPDDLREFVDILSHQNEDGAKMLISRQEFLDGLEKERNAVNERAMMKLEKRLDDIDERIYSGISSLESSLQRHVGVTPWTPAHSMASRPAYRSSSDASSLSSPQPDMQLRAFGVAGGPARIRPR